MMQQLAQNIWNARLNGSVISSTSIEPFSVSTAYEIQQQIVALSGAKQIGWKVGSTSAEAQARLGTDEPGAGPLLDRFCYEDGADVPIYPTHDVHIEAEFAFVMGADLTPQSDYTHEQLATAIAAFRPGLEIVGSRFQEGLSGAGRALVTADCGANIAFVAGPEQTNWQELDLAEQSVTLQLNGKIIEQGTGARALGHPLNVLQWLARHCAQRNIPLKAGDIVTTGTCTGLVPIASDDEIKADFSELGQVSAHFIAA